MLLGGKAQEYEYFSIFANEALEKIGQIRRRPKWLRFQSKMPLRLESLSTAGILLRHLRHFDASVADLLGPNPRLC